VSAVPSRDRAVSNAWIGSRATVERAVRLIVEEGALDDEAASVEKLAERLGMGRRQLARLFAGT
jgi:AraC family transcriptional regulator of adaptative response/methylated-DNA-[protein]-cysteine methyltransferase